MASSCEIARSSMLSSLTATAGWLVPVFFNVPFPLLVFCIVFLAGGLVGLEALEAVVVAAGGAGGGTEVAMGVSFCALAGGFVASEGGGRALVCDGDSMTVSIAT
jgi:hypothetical protein